MDYHRKEEIKTQSIHLYYYMKALGHANYLLFPFTFSKLFKSYYSLHFPNYLGIISTLLRKPKSNIEAIKVLVQKFRDPIEGLTIYIYD